MTRILVATQNKKKLAEIKRIIDVPGVEFISPGDLDTDYPEIEETGETFEENAAIKALAAARACGMLALADDSGLEVDALGGAPGVYSARFSGPGATDESNNKHLLEQLADTPPPRTARYVAIMALASPDGIIATTRGTCEGEIVFEGRGTGGFGYDPFFLPKGEKRTMAELSPEEKNAISHRGAALRAIRPKIEELQQGVSPRSHGA